MTSAIDKEIDVMIRDLAVEPNGCYIRKDFTNILKSILLKSKIEGWTAFVYGSSAHGLATKQDTTDICITNIYYTTKRQQQEPDDMTNEEEFDRIPDTNDVVNVETLAHRLSTVLRKNYYDVFVFPLAPIPFLTVKEKYSSIQFNISVDNTLDIERSNLITEYLALDNRVKPFLFALRRFVKRKEINNEKNGYPSSYVYIMMGLYFLMFVQEPPVIPCLHAKQENTPCRYPVCRSRTKETVQGFGVSYHDCANIDRVNEIDEPAEEGCCTTGNAYGTLWISKNTKSVGDLVMELFRWFSYSTTILEPKSIHSHEAPVRRPEWEGHVMVFVDVFEPKFNIGASCTATGAKIINKEFVNAYIMLKKNPSFDKVLQAPDTVLKPISIKLDNYTRGRKSSK
ncbi:hypothetical protein BD770DRAFT_468551 [Pilaira anomala]|nr:hypothetical protein BD770DRAFT_468551 [Pilaira anomala]